ncbi:MAG: hypothetical protein GYA14_01145 [Ignavibacteria bacterium]|nr:hypothetical protein [Ignavibacteria bacterium]
MALGIIITALIILSGLIKIFSERNREVLGQNFEEMKNWFAIPSVINPRKESLIQTPDSAIVRNKLDEEFNDINSQLLNDEEWANDFNYNQYEERNTPKKLIAHKSVTKSMTLVKVY